VVFQDQTDPNTIVTHHGQEGGLFGIIEVDSMIVRETRTTVTILWQDGSYETLASTDLIPYINVDEYDCWPGDYVMWKGEGVKRVAVVQSVDALQRTAEVLWLDPQPNESSKEMVSLLELDPHGISTAPMGPHNETFGVRRGNFVFIHPEGTTNGAELPIVPRIGEREDWTRGLPSPSNAALRAEMAKFGREYMNENGTIDAYVEDIVDRDISWFGEVVDLKLDGKIEVLLANGETLMLPLHRLTLLPDAMPEDFAEMWDEEMPSPDTNTLGIFTEEVIYEPGHMPGQFPEEIEDEGGWETMSEDEADVDVDMDADLEQLQEDEVMRNTSDAPQPMDIPEMQSQTDPLTLSTQSPPTPEPHSQTSSGPPKDNPHTQWQRFLILPNAPNDHAFLSRASTTRPRSYLARLNKEYRALTSSLPETILVRAYEDRTDLLRTLIIGPENTPYEDAPFMIDWYLDDRFPSTPPEAHFHSWTSGNGRVNPNLYEEGKVCLSILGTWSGEASESWSVKSSLLQAFVSIQGLVLVREPWFCEPAYEKLRGTDEGIVNSRLYSEKAYVLSRGFVRRALEVPPGGLEDELKWYYFTCNILKRVIEQARSLMKESEESDGNNSFQTNPLDQRAVKYLSAGARLLLSRTLPKLEGIQAIHDSQ
jgi:ubiquitin-conjugating enzyme E2 O